jgi:glutathione peroxidase
MTLSLSRARRTGRAPSLSPLCAGSALLLLALGACKASESAKPPEAAAPSAATAAPAPATPSATAAAPTAAAPAAAAPASIYGFKMNRLDGSPSSLSEWSGKVLLIVNTASKCGYTPQYEGLQKLHAKYSPRGFAVLGFPSNDFGGQEPGSAEEIAKFCTSIYAVNFPMFAKTKVVGEERNELYALLSNALGEPKWNFHKYLIDKQGHPVQAWGSKVEPGTTEIASAIETQLAAQ